MVYLGWLGSHPLTIGFKYAGQAWRTWRILRRERPDAVFLMVPPVFAALVVWAYGALHRVPFVLDAHTAAFLHPRWRAWQWLQRALSRRAATTIVTNEHLASRGARGGRSGDAGSGRADQVRRDRAAREDDGVSGGGGVLVQLRRACSGDVERGPGAAGRDIHDDGKP